MIARRVKLALLARVLEQSLLVSSRKAVTRRNCERLYVAAREVVMKNPVIDTMIDWYLVLRDISALQHLGSRTPTSLAIK